MVSKVQKQAETSQRLVTVASSWELKHYGDTISKEEYVEHYAIDVENVGGIAELTGGAKVVNNMGNYNLITYSSEVKLPFAWDQLDPESKGNFARFEHAAKIRDSLLVMDLTKVKKLALDEFEKGVK